MAQQGGREGREKDAEHDEKAGVCPRRKREIDDARRTEKFERAGDQLPGRDARPGIDQLQPPKSHRLQMQGRADDIERDDGKHHQAQAADGGCRHVEQDFHRIGFEQADDAAEQNRAEREGEGTEGDENAHVGERQALGRIRPVAHHGAGKHRHPDIVRQRVGATTGRTRDT